jgi:hypothetical protein
MLGSPYNGPSVAVRVPDPCATCGWSLEFRFTGGAIWRRPLCDCATKKCHDLAVELERRDARIAAAAAAKADPPATRTSRNSAFAARSEDAEAWRRRRDEHEATQREIDLGLGIDREPSYH